MNPISIGKHISTIYRHQNMLINKLFEAYAISNSQYLFIIKINEYEGINIRDLSQHLALDKANVSRGIKKLEALGYVQVLASVKDKRNKELYLTTTGQSLVKTIRRSLPIVTDTLTKGFTDEELIHLNKALIKMEANILSKTDHLRKGVHHDIKA